ncbi:GNAT family N-acetyltransferase [Francisella adeliensis]|uniref:GNAT family N-acetyltransferase n=1 Tax=Francisella adeliensis TaxID=2007306 RepID=A0A2Z4Y172_9GAMM|nr:RimJ/RimL family protein N-acetyltransferase [Francisella adeliensis]MBK2086323.1 GNAT family N-acetyltransferase [Francisella adeliensis]MBK2096538.1 GNAT family N-acetyltransferase [Francisella adeliensis]QIW12997.1 GNAT family N-acetyltransferase [Francisella adeliensis]QIW14873.1 GNAT family N-acetyltransferase [Francisella adeliensis]
MFSIKIDKDISLALVQESFAPIYFKLIKENATYLERWLPWVSSYKSEQDSTLFIRKSLHDYADGKSMVCAIWFNNELVGNASFNSINHSLKKVEIGYWVKESAQGSGIITRVCNKLIDIAFNELKMQKVQISVAVENLASRAVCKRLGMKLEGIISNAENLNGQIVDHAIYAQTSVT